MIVFELICSSQHRFEGWFASPGEFRRQQQSHIIACPVCATTHVEKLPAAKIRKPAPQGEGTAEPVDGKMPAAGPDPSALLASLIQHILQHTEDVGKEFPAEARRIHYEEVPPRGIRGVAN